MPNRWETMETVRDFIFLGSKITVDSDCSHEIKRYLIFGRKAMTNLDSILKNRHDFTEKDPSSQSYDFSSSHVWWELDHEENWSLKNWCFWTMMLEKALESPLDRKEIKPVNPKWNQSFQFIGRIDAEASILWPPDVKNWLTGKDPVAGKDWRQEEKVQQRTRRLDVITDSKDVSLSNFWEIVKDREAWRAIVHGVTKSQTRLSDWTRAIITNN